LNQSETLTDSLDARAQSDEQRQSSNDESYVADLL